MTCDPKKNKGQKHEECKYSQQFPLFQTSNEFKQKQQNRFITEPPLFPRLEGQQKTTTFGRNLDPTGELKHQQSCKKIPPKKKHENQHRNFAQKVQNINIYVYIYLHKVLDMLLMHPLCMYFSPKKYLNIE